MSSSGPYGRHGYTAPSSNGGYTQQSAGAPGMGGGYATPGASAYSAGGYGQGYGGPSYSAPTPTGGYGGVSYANAGSYGQPVDANQGLGDEGEKGKKGKKSIALQALNQNILMWAGFFTVSIFVYYLLSAGDFSFLMTYGAMSRMFGFGILLVKMYTSKRASGVSAKTLQLYCIVFVSRLSSIVRHEGYLPYDKSGDWLYHWIEFFGLFFSAGALYGCLKQFNSTYQKDVDKFGEMNVPEGYGAVYLACPILLLAMVIHPNLNTDFLSDVAWTYSMYLESLALVPQLYMFQKQKNGVVELLTAHFVAALGFGRILEFAFWLYSYHELSGSSGSTLPGYIALIAQVLQMFLMLDFFWYYLKAVKNATPLVLPTQNAMGMV